MTKKKTEVSSFQILKKCTFSYANARFLNIQKIKNTISSLSYTIKKNILRSGRFVRIENFALNLIHFACPDLHTL